MAQLGGAQREPSMEEILASIRRIIEDSDTGRKPDEGSPVQPANDLTAPPAAAASTAPEAAGTVIEVEAFRSDLRARSGSPEAARGIFGDADRRSPAAEDAPASSTERSDGDAAAVRAGSMAGADDWRLGVPLEDMVGDVHDDAFAEEIASAVLDDVSDDALHSDEPGLEATAQAARPALISEQAGKQVAAAFGELSEAFAARSRRNLDEMAEAMLRPMLQDWLDNNLPHLVERLVREEIERVARGA